MKKLTILITMLILLLCPVVKAEEQNAINLEDIHVFLDFKELGTLDKLNEKVYIYNVDEFYINFRVAQEGVEVISETGKIKLTEFKTEIPITLKKNNQEYKYKIYIKRENVEDKVVKENKIDKEDNEESSYAFSKEIRITCAVVILTIIISIMIWFIKEKDYKLVLLFCLIAFILVLLIHILNPVVVHGHSMKNTLHSGEMYLSIKQNSYKRNDIVTASIKRPESGLKETIIKRVVGIPKDTIEIKNNSLYINGKLQKEDYIKEKMNTFDMKITLKEDEYFLMGDNRNNSLDSRRVGPIKLNKIDSRILFKH